MHARLTRGCMSRLQAVTRGISPGGDESDGSGDSEQERAPTRGRGSRSGAAKAGGTSRRRASAASEPGPPLEGALVRIDAWPLDGPDGQPLPRSVSQLPHCCSQCVPAS